MPSEATNVNAKFSLRNGFQKDGHDGVDMVFVFAFKILLVFNR